MDYFAANDLAAFISLGGSPEEQTTAGSFDPTYTNKSMDGVTGAFGFGLTNPDDGSVATLTDGWFHCDVQIAGGSAAVVIVVNDAGVPVARVWQNYQALRLDYWNGAAWVNGADTFAVASFALVSLDLHFIAGAAGSLTLYVNQSHVLEVDGLSAAVTNFRTGQLGNGAGNDKHRYSQVLVSDENTVGAKVGSPIPNANGNWTDWANDYVNVVKVGYNDATLISSSTLDAKESYVASDVALPPNYVISSVWFAIRARLNSGAPANIKPLLRMNGVDYLGYSFQGLNPAAYAPSLAAFAVNPATGTAWEIANINTAELGFQTAA